MSKTEIYEQQCVIVEVDYKGNYSRFALTPEEFAGYCKENSIENVVFDESNHFSDTLKPLVHIWCDKTTVGSEAWNVTFSDMEWGLPPSDIDANNKAYIDFDSCKSLATAVRQTWNLSQLPDVCYDTLKSTNEVIIIKKGEKGYYKTDFDCPPSDAEETVRFYNERLGVTEEQRMAMSGGSMYGWNTPSADPAVYAEMLKKEKPSVLNELGKIKAEQDAQRGGEPPKKDKDKDKSL